MSWRSIRVDDEKYRWTVSIGPMTRAVAELSSVRVTVIVRGVSIEKRIAAVFHGFCVEDLFDGRQQNIAVTPRTVAEIVRRFSDQAVIDHAERLLPDAVTSADPQDAMLKAACSKWFVPYPGREALETALNEADRNFQVVADRFSSSAVQLTSEQIRHWSKILGI